MMGAEKHEARQTARAARASMSGEARAAASLAVAERAMALPQVAGAFAVLAYAAMPEELDPSPLVDALRVRGARVAYPRVCGPGELALHWCDDANELAAGYCGIAEPAADAPEVAAEELDLVLVPGTAFDAACARLGMGGGFYDRLLAGAASQALAVGLAFDEQIVDAVPVEAHDVALDVVVTPTRTLTSTR
jgi:5-formyltetrahydrofolate cyclo-ligase